MKKLKKIITDKDKYSRFLTELSWKITGNESISDNPMYDGFCIGYIILRSDLIWKIIFKDEYVGRMMDGTIQQVEVAVGWMSSNEGKLCDLINQSNT